ncbi:sensor histidine kinase [Methyloversatilis thermotolerans]|uniref:sensor histidine kinase n=1 Tax=Methyloversatilis thermotolerans TaxID=1346290 RepID=UPI0003709525|nr:HAMP domain-containing sensor histidine kinase [Methyloversatilis thermotolerans]
MAEEINTSGTGALLDSATVETDRDAVRRDLLGVLFDHTPTIVAGNLAVSLTASVVLMQGGDVLPLALWLSAIWLLVLLRLGFVRRCRSRLADFGRSQLDHTESRYATIASLTGLVWGLLPWISYDGVDAFRDFFGVAMLAGMAGGAVTATSSLPRALNGYLVFALLPFIVKAAWMGGAVNLGGAITLLFYLVALIAFGRDAHTALKHALELTRQNARLAEHLRRERDAVQATMRAKNLFLAGVTHDLRQPVHAVGLHVRYLRALQAGGLSASAMDEVCTGLDGAVRAMSSQLTRLLELSRLEAGETRVSRRAMSVNELWSDCAAQFAPLAQEKGLRLAFRPSEAQIDSDPMMLRSMLDNLVSNAVRYTERGRVLVAARRRGADIELQVWDTGAGIPAEHLPHIFEPYRRFDDRALRHDEGQGLGLALVQRQADLLGHALSVRSRAGHGSVFTLRVPSVTAV